MTEDRPKASVALRVAAALCLAALGFATVRIIGRGAGEPLGDFLSHMGGAPARWILVPMPFGVFAALYVLVTGRVPNFKVSPVELDDNPVKPKGHTIGMVIIWCLLALVVVAVVYGVYFIGQE